MTDETRTAFYDAINDNANAIINLFETAVKKCIEIPCDTDNEEVMISSLTTLLKPYVSHRLSVCQTSDAYEVGQDFAIWDSKYNDYYFDTCGFIPTYPTEAEANEGLESVITSIIKKSLL